MSGFEGGYRGTKWRKQGEVDVKNSGQRGKSRPQVRGAYLERLGDGGRAIIADLIEVEVEVLQRLVDLPRHAQHARNEWFRGWLRGQRGYRGRQMTAANI